MFFSCNKNIDGCVDIDACNYNPNANSDDQICYYYQLTNDWNIQVVASMNPWTILDPIFDENNILGVSNNSLDDFDSMDTPEPPSSPGNWISGYFHHPEWDSIFGDKFTQDYKSNEFCESKEWNFIVEANSTGPMELLFIFNNVPDSLQLDLIYEESLVLSDSLTINLMLEENTPQEFLIKVGIN